ncbi:Hypothetical predicted protein, partial [Podarcis lilfordi]
CPCVDGNCHECDLLVARPYGKILALNKVIIKSYVKPPFHLLRIVEKQCRRTVKRRDG